MSLRKIAGPPGLSSCQEEEHFPPQHLSLTPGVYEWTCPVCQHRTTFTVNGPIYDATGGAR